MYDFLSRFWKYAMLQNTSVTFIEAIYEKKKEAIYDKMGVILWHFSTIWHYYQFAFLFAIW